MIQKAISIDMNLINSTVLWRVQQNEVNSRQLNATLTVNKKPFEIPDGTFIIFKWASVDGKSGMETCTYSDGIVTTTIPSQLCLQRGIITCKYSIVVPKESFDLDAFNSTESYSEYITENAISIADSTAFKITVDADVIGDTSLSQIPEYHIFLDYVSKIVQVEEAVFECNSKINTNTENIGINAENIALNAQYIIDNAADINQNAQGIAENAKNIATNTQGIKDNSDGIAENSRSIAKNTEAITENTKEIQRLSEAMNNVTVSNIAAIPVADVLALFD